MKDTKKKSTFKEKSTLSDAEKAFLVPLNATHRMYEALRAFFVDELPSNEVAKKFGYTPGSFRVLCSKFRKNPIAHFL